MEWILLIIFLLCPLMMLFMHGGHRGHGHNHGSQNHVHQKRTNENFTGEEEHADKQKIKRLEEEIEYLKAQNEMNIKR